MISDTFIRNRITELRLIKGVSEYKMSYDLGHSKSYIQSISSGRAMPSLSEFLYICDYFGISPKDFFDEQKTYSPIYEDFCKTAASLDDATLRMLLPIMEQLKEKQ